MFGRRLLQHVICDPLVYITDYSSNQVIIKNRVLGLTNNTNRCIDNVTRVYNIALSFLNYCTLI